MIKPLDETSSIHGPATLWKDRNGPDYVKAFYAKFRGKSIVKGKGPQERRERDCGRLNWGPRIYRDPGALWNWPAFLVYSLLAKPH